MLIRLNDGSARADISLKGGELHAWRIGSRSLLWERDPEWWDQSAPILFPVVGWANGGHARIDGRSRPIPLHGFAAKSDFVILEQSPKSVTLMLAGEEARCDSYPFPFRLLVTYRLENAGLSVDFAVENAGRRVMPYALGFHPAFRWPIEGFNRQEHVVIFEAEENPDVPVIAPGGLISTRKRRVPLRGRRLDLTDELLAADAICFLDANSRSFSLCAGSEGPSIRLEASDFPHLALWSRPGAPFISMETWTGHSDPEGFVGELVDKPSMRLLSAGATARHSVNLLYRDSG